MKKSVLLFSLLSGTALMFPRLTIASGILPTHTGTPEPKPAFQFEQLDKAYKTAGVCFLGVGDCGGAAGYDSSSSGAGSANDDFYIDTTNQCLNEGFVRQNCNSVQTIDGVCPYNSAYGLGCKCLPDLSPVPPDKSASVKAATKCTLHANATPRWLPVRPKKTVPVPNAAENINPASASRNINILLPTVLIRVRYRGTAAADNIPTAFVRPGLTKGRTAAPNIILLPVLRSARWPTPTTAISGKA